jgi:hypothetical protein
VVTARIGGREVEASRPDTTTPGAFSVDVLTTLARARRGARAACLLTDGRGVPAIVCDDVPVVSAGRVAAAWIGARLGAVALAGRAAAWRRGASASFWHELHRELRRHSGDTRLPSSLRERLREGARAAFARSAPRSADVQSRFPRRALREPVRVALRLDLERAAREATADALDLDGPIAAVEAGEGALAVAASTLRREGFRVVPIGAVARPDGSTDNGDSVAWLRDVAVLQRARLVVCASEAWQHAAYLTDTPALRVNAPEPFSAYPVRANGVFTLRQAIHLDTGRMLDPTDQLTPSYLRNLRNHGHRDTPPEQVRAAVRELLEGMTTGWAETAGQQRFREDVAAAAPEAGAAIPALQRWDAEDGFVGDGRLARCQADTRS